MLRVEIALELLKLQRDRGLTTIYSPTIEGIGDVDEIAVIITAVVQVGRRADLAPIETLRRRLCRPSQFAGGENSLAQRPHVHGHIGDGNVVQTHAAAVTFKPATPCVSLRPEASTMPRAPRNYLSCS